jgi:hypothetical protein
MANGAYQNGNVITNGAAGYIIVGTGDFNGDGTSDVLLQNGGTVVDWIMQNGVYQNGNVITNGAIGYKVVGIGDLNGDGTADVMWYCRMAAPWSSRCGVGRLSGAEPRHCPQACGRRRCRLRR